MKWLSLHLTFKKILQATRQIGPFSRLFMILSLSTALVIVSIGMLVLAQSKSPRIPSSSMKGLASSISNQFFLDILGMELPFFTQGTTDSTISNKNVVTFLFQMLTDINPRDPKTLLSRELPGLANERTSPLYGVGTASSGGPTEYDPHPEAIKTDPTPVPIEENKLEPSPSATAEQSIIANTNKAVFIYHSHNRESWLPELKNVKDPDMAFDSKKNVTLLGGRMAQRLEKMGIGTVHSNKDYPSSVADFKYPKSYQYSKQTVVEAINRHTDLKLLFDIHRDSQSRSKTTITIKNKDYAQIYFVIGEKNPNWETNTDLARKIHEKINKKYPGLSKGIYSKSSNGNGEYNQSLNPNISLIEIGGVENTLEESYRTADVLADVIADLYRESENAAAPLVAKVNAPSFK